jgi:hypothetical protein
MPIFPRWVGVDDAELLHVVSPGLGPDVPPFASGLLDEVEEHGVRAEPLPAETKVREARVVVGLGGPRPGQDEEGVERLNEGGLELRFAAFRIDSHTDFYRTILSSSDEINKRGGIGHQYLGFIRGPRPLDGDERLRGCI